MDYIKLLSACVAVGITGGSFAVVATPVHAKSPIVVVADADIVTRHISYADLNLASSSGETTLHRRVGGGIQSLCLEATGGDLSFIVESLEPQVPNLRLEPGTPQIALAVQRSHDIALTGASPIAAVAITIDLTK